MCSSCQRSKPTLGLVCRPCLGGCKHGVTVSGWISATSPSSASRCPPKPWRLLRGLRHAGGAWVRNLERFWEFSPVPEPGTGCLGEPCPSPCVLAELPRAWGLPGQESGAAGARFRSLQPAGVGWRRVVPRNWVRSFLFWWFSGQICTVRESDKLWSGSHTRPRAEPQTVEDSRFVVAHDMLQTWLHAEDTGDRTGGSGRVQEGAHPFSSAQPVPWVVPMLNRGRKTQSPV